MYFLIISIDYAGCTRAELPFGLRSEHRFCCYSCSKCGFDDCLQAWFREMATLHAAEFLLGRGDQHFNAATDFAGDVYAHAAFHLGEDIRVG